MIFLKCKSRSLNGLSLSLGEKCQFLIRVYKVLHVAPTLSPMYLFPLSLSRSSAILNFFSISLMSNTPLEFKIITGFCPPPGILPIQILYMKRVFRICSGLNLEILFSKKSSLILLSYERMIILSVIFATITTAKSNDLWLAPNFFPCYMTVASCSSLSLLISRSRLLEQSQCIKRHSLEIYNASNKLLLRHGTHDILLIPVDQTMSHRQVHRHWIEMYTLPVKSKQQGNGKWHWILSLGTEEKTLRLII